MKKLLSFLFILLSTSTFAQNEEESEEFKQHVLGIYIGGSSSQGDFGNQSTANQNAGLAEGGLILGINYQYNIDKNFALTADYGGIAHRYNARALAVEISNRTATLVQVTADPYTLGYLNVGAKAVTGTNLRAYVNPSIGIATFVAPQIIIDASSTNGTIRQTIREGEASTSFNLGIGFGGELQISPLISISLDFDYFTSKHEYQQVLETFDNNGSPTLVAEEIEQTYESFNTSFGLYFNF